MPRSLPPAERDITPDERLLWRMITRDDLIYDNAGDDLAELLDVDDYAAEQAVRAAPAHIVLQPQLKTSGQTEYFPLVVGEDRGLSRASARRLKRGQMPIDMILDLHGSSQIDAQERLAKCIHRSAEQRRRLLLVITGKGNRGGGVLRQMLPLWLNEPHIRPFVLAVRGASVKDGAGGAFYVLLRQKA